MKHNLRDIHGKFAPHFNIVPGRLYGFKGTVVRAGQAVGDMRNITLHKTLKGTVRDSELRILPAEKVQEYLKHAE